MGLDLLKHTHAVIDLVKNQVLLGNRIVCATSRTTPDGESYQVSRVRLKKKVRAGWYLPHISCPPLMVLNMLKMGFRLPYLKIIT